MDKTELSDREREVLVWISKGKSTQDIAAILEISVATVSFHYRSVASKFGTTNRTQTVVEAIRRGLIEA
ncbi:MAG TPA: helix-turn-helix domain-containing protein [Devosia sp.]|nr:helix-turn-helix domain-containing protein [Devosia sp.]